MEQWEINLRAELLNDLPDTNLLLSNQNSTDMSWFIKQAIIDREVEKERFIRARISAAKEYLSYTPNDNFLETFLKYT